jgi:hypothetical protein
MMAMAMTTTTMMMMILTMTRMQLRLASSCVRTTAQAPTKRGVRSALHCATQSASFYQTKMFPPLHLTPMET